MIEINLLPGAQRKTRGGNPFAASAIVAGVREQLKNTYLIVGVTGLVVGLLAIGGMYLHQTRRQSALDARGAAASADSTRFAVVLSARAHAEMSRDSVYQQLAIIKSIDDSRYSWPHLLQEVNLAVPQYTWLTAVTQTSPITSGATFGNDTSVAGRARMDSLRKSTKASDRKALEARMRAHADSLYNGVANTTMFRITGQTVDLQALTLFMKNLESSPYIKNVQLTRSDLVTADGKEVTEFQLEAQSEIPPLHMKSTIPLAVAVR